VPEKVNAVPEGFHTVTPSLVVRKAAEAIDFYRRAFGAEEICRMRGPDGKSVVHAELKIGDSIIFLSDEFPEMGSRGPESLGGTATTIHLYVPDVDAVFQQAIAAGAQSLMPVQDQFWGDRFGTLVDPYGHRWSISTHIEDVSPEECERRAAEAFANKNCG
jgi:PhnB protein